MIYAAVFPTLSANLGVRHRVFSWLISPDLTDFKIVTSPSAQPSSEFAERLTYLISASARAGITAVLVDRMRAPDWLEADRKVRSSACSNECWLKSSVLEPEGRCVHLGLRASA